jgi:crotonobetainyl-CoA:carnitine CoA-transferase CaiB-like acyl-CoA transferase
MTDHLRAHETAAPMAETATGPLVGLRILDLTHAAAGPYGTMMLADMGAEVIKIEPPRGELVRDAGPFTVDDEQHEYGGRFANRNRNKRSIALDLTVEEDRETFFELVETADALLENMRAGVLDRLGVGWEECHARNPRLVYAAVRGFGDPRTGASPYSDWPAFDVVAQAMGGFVASTGADAQHPMRTGPTIGDYVPGLMAALGLLAAVMHARNTGEGQFVDVGMTDGLMSMCETSQMMWTYRGTQMQPTGNTVEAVVPFGIYATADGHCALAAPTQDHWSELCAVMGRADLVDDERTSTQRARAGHRDLIDAAITEWMSTQVTADVVASLGGRVSVGPVQGPMDWTDDPHVAAREMLVSVEHPHHRPTVQVNCPIKFTATPSGIYRRPPLLNEDGDALRADLRSRAADQD